MSFLGPTGFEQTAHPIFFQSLRHKQRKRVIFTKINTIPHDQAGESETSFHIDDIICPICLGNMDEIALQCNCAHAFCKNCIIAWYDLQDICPLCKLVTDYVMVENCQDRSLDICILSTNEIICSPINKEQSQQISSCARSMKNLIDKRNEIKNNQRC